MRRTAMELSMIELKSLLCERGVNAHPWNINKNYFIRTVTHHYTGTLIAVYQQELVLRDAAWIADNGRFMQAVATGSFSEVEPFPDGREVVIGRGSIIDAIEISFPIPRSQK
jgi:hypothetical protein